MEVISPHIEENGNLFEGETLSLSFISLGGSFGLGGGFVKA